MINNDILNNSNVITLKKICRNLHIKKYSALKKSELISLINEHHSILKIQRWTRKVLCKNEPCPISLEPIRYPCFAFKTKNNVLIYYNLHAFKDFLIKTGDFRDPISRTPLTELQLITMDEIDNYSKTINKTDENIEKLTKSVYRASKNTKFYERMKEKECELLSLERILDNICQEIKNLIDENNSSIFVLNTTYLYDYQIQFRRVITRSRDHAEYVIDKNIKFLYTSLQKETKYTQKQVKTCEYIITWMYQLREEAYLN
jgi:hypothetical protein